MSRSRVVSSILAATILLILATATMSFALSAVDSAGKVIGEVVGHEFDETKVIAKLKNTPYQVMLGRHTIRGTDIAYYAQKDCGGAPYINMHPDERIPIIVFPSALGANGTMYIMRRVKMFEVVLASYWDAYNGECENFQAQDLLDWVTPLQPVGNLGTSFKAPYNVR